MFVGTGVCLEKHFRNHRGMQDGATFHTAHNCRTLNFSQAHRVDILPWPSKSPGACGISSVGWLGELDLSM